MIHLNTVGVPSVDIAYNVRDLDSSADNAVQAVALQYRTDLSSPWTNVSEAFIADATTVGTATQVTPVAVTLPGDAGNQAQLQVRIITGNAVGNDEAVGIDDIVVKPTPIASPPGNFQVDANGLRVREDAGVARITVTRQGGTGGEVTVDYTTAGLSATAGQDYVETSGTIVFVDGQSSADVEVPLLSDSLDELAEQFTFTLGNPTGGAGLNPSFSNVVTIIDANGHRLSDGPLTQDWSDTGLITQSDDWNAVWNITGYLSDADRDAGLVDVIANQSNPGGQSQGGVGEFDGISDPTIALQGSNAASAPQLILDVNTLGMTEVLVAFDAIDIDNSADDAVQSISVGYRIGNSGDFQEIYFLEDATEGPSLAGLITAVSVALPVDALNQELVQIRVATNNAAGNDEWVGIDNIVIGGGSVVLPPPTLDSATFAYETSQSIALQFSQDVLGSLAAEDIVVTNITTGVVVPTSAYTVESSTTGNNTTATLVTFTSVLDDGNYELRVLANGIAAPGGETNPADLVAGFFVLAGDADRDRDVDFDDLLTLAQNYGQSGRTFSQGNFDYSGDGLVSFDDLLLLAQRYGRSLFSAAPIVEPAPARKDPAPARKRGGEGLSAGLLA